MKFLFTFKGMEPSGAKGSRVQGNAVEGESDEQRGLYQQRLKDMITEKTERRFERVLKPEEGTLTVMVTREKNNWLLLDMTLKALGESFMGSEKLVESSTNIDLLIDTVLSKLERQLLKRKELLKERWKQRGAQG